MAEDRPGDSTGRSITLADYIDRDSDSIFGKVDFLGLIGDIGKAEFVALLSFFSGIAIAAQESIRKVGDSIRETAFESVDALLSIPLSIQESAVATAAKDVVEFEIFALPAGTVVTLSVFVVLAVIVFIFVGGDT